MADDPEQTPYYLAARFSNEGQAEREYFRLQSYIQNPRLQLDLSVYRLKPPGESESSTVVVLGDHPGEEIDRRLKRALSAGETVTLDEDVLQFLQERRAMGTQLGPWVEGHYRPGKGYDLNR